MPQIPDLTVRPLLDTSVQTVHSWVSVPPVVNAVSPPVTINLGTPIIQIPGCVKAHPGSNKSNTIKADDPKGVRVYCDANQPTFTPLDYTPENLIYQKPAKFAGYKSANTNKNDAGTSEDIPNTPPTIPPTGAPPNTAGEEKDKEEPVELVCDEGYDLVDKECIEIIEEVKAEISFAEKYLPTLPQATTTATIAVVATTSALMAKPLADLLLKLVKPTVKKIMKKIASLRGQSQKVESVSQRQLAQRDRNRAIRALRVALKK